MAATVIVNKLSVVHKKSDGKSIASPDPCLTPSPPVPVPYVNVAFSKDLADHARTVFADGRLLCKPWARFDAPARCEEFCGNRQS